MNNDGTMNEEAGPYKGMDRFDCRKKILEDLESAGLIDKIEDHANAVGHCYRCHTMVEPRLSPQWFVKMKPLAGPALEAVKTGKIRFVPDRWTKVYTEWMENIRDWCISRQIWWGHRIPVFYCDACGHEWAAKGQPDKCPKCGDANIRQDEDVLDTWFSSWLWPFSVFGWPEQNEDLKFYYPTATLVTASEIIFFWVARMIMSGMEFMDDIPFSDVYIHGTVRDNQGRKMSKSLGNSIDPLTIIEKYSADALRFSLIMLTATGQDVFLSDDKFEIGRNFGTKIWNAARYMQMQSAELPAGFDNPEFKVGSLSPDDAHILAKLNETIAACTESLERFRFNDTAKALYEFFWHQFCDWYVESSKQVFYGEDPAKKQQVLTVMHYAFSNALRLLHPIMPFLTEELWTGMGYNGKHETIMRAPWPKVRDGDELEDWGIDQDTVTYVDAKHDLIRVGRVLMSDYNLLPKHSVEFIVRPADAKLAERLKADLESVKSLLRAGKITVDESAEPLAAMPSGLTRMGTVYMPVKGLIDAAAERKRLSDQLAKVDDNLQRVTRKLGNLDFVSKAPKDVIAKQEDIKKELIEKSEKLNKLIATLS